MTKIAACSGGCGDATYAIPILRELGVTTLYLKLNYYFAPYGSLYSTMKSLMEHEGFETLPTNGGYDAMKYEPGLKFDYDIDSFRKQPGRGRIWIPTNMRRHFGLPAKKYEPWLSLPVSDGDYTVIHLTDRWRTNSKVDWKKILFDLKDAGEKILFTGFQHEWLDFCTRYGNVEWCPTDDVLDMAKMIAGAKQVYCNQSVALTLAQGSGKKYFLERNPGKTNCLTGGSNENLLN